MRHSPSDVCGLALVDRPPEDADGEKTALMAISALLYAAGTAVYEFLHQ